MAEREPDDRAALRRLVAGLIAACVAAQCIALTGSADALGVAALGDSFFASSLLAAALLAAVTLPRKLALGALAAGALAEVGLIFVLPRPGDPAAWLVARGAGLGLTALAALALHAWRSTGEARAQALDALGCAAVLPLFVAASSVALDLTSTLHPLTLDGPCLYADRLLGQPSFVVGRLFGAVPPIGQLCAVIYGELPLFCAALLVVERRRLGRWPVEVLGAFVALGVAGYLCYHLFPVAGPRFFVRTWPGRVPELDASLAQASALPPVPRNCMPSLHTAWILLCVYFARRGSVVFRALGWLWVAGTLLATLGLGLHYGVDLIAALPFLAAFLWWWPRRAPVVPGASSPPWRAMWVAFGAAGSVLVAGGALRTLFGDGAERILVLDALAGAALGLAWSVWRSPISLRTAAVGVVAIAAALPLWIRLGDLAGGGGPIVHALIALPAVAGPLALAAAALPTSSACGLAASLGALFAAALLPAAGRAATALIVAAPALAAALRPTAIERPTPSPTSPGRGALVFLAGALISAAALASYARLASASGDDFLTTPLFVAVFAGALSLGGRRRLRWPLAVLALGLTLALAAWSWPAVPDYLAGFDGYPAVRTLGARATVRLAVGVWTVAPFAFAAGILGVAATGAEAPPTRRLLLVAGALTGALLTIRPRAPDGFFTRGFLQHESERFDTLTLDLREIQSREAWALVRAHLADRGVAIMPLPLERLPPDRLRVLVATAATALPHLAVVLDGDDARLVGCAAVCPAPRGAHLGSGELQRFLGAAAINPDDAIATDDNLLLAEALAPLRAAGASSVTTLALLRSFAAP